MTDAFTVQGIPVTDLADRFGTPLYVYDAEVLADAYTELRRRLHPAVDIFYSAKANPNVSVCAVMRSLGAGLEVSSLAELATARWAGTAPDDVIFLGPGKSEEELRACLEYGIAAVVCESLEELETLDRLSPPGRRVLLRVNPAFTTKGARLSMGGKPRQFGIDHEMLLGSGSALRALRNVRVAGIHAYMGTRILDADGVVQNTAGILAAARELSAELGFPLETVDIGGGLGIAYFENEKDLDLDRLTDGVNAVVGEFAAEHPGCRVIMELGRYLAGRCGMYVVRARYVKRSKGEWFVVTDGGMNHHMAAVGVGSFVKRNFPIRSIDRHGELADRMYTVTGPLCTPDDVLGRRVALPEVRPGDLIGVERSGAYGPTSSPVLFLSHGYPAEVLVSGATAHLVRHRDTVGDLLGRQVLVDPPAPGPDPVTVTGTAQTVPE
ncbi:type III PLP-dependent enzyme [Microbispora sp. RL4-1S]|uniref:Type III PLP-dependent enzyme n=1 Tax=Microbispora oryzae TaxID=2806554 RepID=A0A940WSU4_9ACTN|nr:type III PLP-dependent enzyme [Microbispora oryzae]MBP2706800.1 type III PLP-dependent enzyme [Microbispora oryzae]